jgi:hypothetical protein
MFSQDPQSKFPVLFSFSLLYNLHITVVSKQLKGFNFKMVKSPTYSLEVVDPGRGDAGRFRGRFRGDAGRASKHA